MQGLGISALQACFSILRIGLKQRAKCLPIVPSLATVVSKYLFPKRGLNSKK